MERDELLALRDKILQGDPPFELDALKKPSRKGGTPGLIERRALGQYDTNASGIVLSLEVGLAWVQDRLDRMRK